MKKKKKKQNINKKKYLITGIIFLFVLLSGTTFAYLINTNLGDVNEFLALKNVDIEYVDGESINSSDLQLPMNDDEVEQFSTGNSFTVKNNYSKDIYLRFKLIDLNIDSSTTTVFNDGNLRYALYQGSTKIGGGTLANYDANTYEVVLLNNYMQQASTNKEYTLYVYIKDSWQNQNHFLNTNITGKIRVEGYDKKLPTLATKIIDNNTNLLESVDSDGTTYYFSGNVDNNYIKLGNMDLLWRIVRVNGDGTIRLVSDASIGKSKFNTNIINEKYVGYTYNDTDTNGTNILNTSTIYEYLENWYNSNIENNYTIRWLIANSRYCNDTSISNQDNITYGASSRIDGGTPTLVCPESDKDYGGDYNLKIGLLTADEIALAGNSTGISSSNFYLNKGVNYWTMSPSDYDNYGASNINMYNNDLINYGYVDEELDVFPVINIKSDVLYEIGDGTITNPYIIVSDEEQP